MFELSEIWHTSKREGSAFLERVRVYALPDATVWQPGDWADWAIYWKKEHDAVDSRARQHGAGILGEHGHRRLMQMQRFYTEVADILGTLADIVQPRTFEELERYGLADPARDAPRPGSATDNPMGSQVATAATDPRQVLVAVAAQQWPATRDSNDPSRLRRFEEHFPDTYFAIEARQLREAIEAGDGQAVKARRKTEGL
jgi:hypothetical protein